MNVLEYQSSITRGEFHQRNLPGAWRTWKPKTPAEIAGFTEGRACVWLREQGLLPSCGIGADTARAKSLGWKP